MATTTSNALNADVLEYLAEEVLPIAQRRLVLHQFGAKKRIEKGRGNTWQATRYQRLQLPFAPLSEGVPAPSVNLTIESVVGTALQWGSQVVITDVADLTVFHEPFQQAKRMVGYQVGETLERNDFLTLMGTTQVNYVNNRGSRAGLIAGDVLDPYTVIRTQTALDDLGAPYYGASGEPQIKKSAAMGDGGKLADDPRSNEHYVSVARGLVLADIRQNSSFVTALSYSSINRLYNNEVGEFSNVRFCRSNMVPSFTGVATVAVTAGTAGVLTSGNYFIQVVGVDNQNQYPSRIYQVSGSTAVTGPTGSVSLTTPATAGYTYYVYIGTTSSPANLAKSTAGPSTGPLTGMAAQIPPSTAIVLTDIGIAQAPPAAPATGVTVYPTFMFGEGAFAVIELADIEYFYLDKAEKTDPQNQLRVVAWKGFCGAMILNPLFVARIESTSAFSATFG